MDADVSIKLFHLSFAFLTMSGISHMQPLGLEFRPVKLLYRRLVGRSCTLCLEALRRGGGNKRHAARVLGIARDSLYRHLKRSGIEEDDPTAD